METELFLTRVSAHLARDSSSHPVGPKAGPARTDLPQRREEMLALFALRLAAAGGEAHQVGDRREAEDEICRFLEERGLTIACAPGRRWPELDRFCTNDVSDAGAGLAEATCAVADTGSVLLSHGGEQGRRYSLLPPVSLVLLPASTVAPSLAEVLPALSGLTASQSACATFVTGVSHSADIACVPCRGVHGPGEVHVWSIGDE